ncbi:hypothetical protein DAI22_07g128250 [Oryza sativa Japonica Group]|nr:hypothetical protein DAI22_07g128250 [Oryza sativa Japonica Group]
MEALPNGMFRVRLENDTIILGYISGKIRSSSIRILMGDLGRKDSNLRVTGPKPAALPLGHAPFRVLCDTMPYAPRGL